MIQTILESVILPLMCGTAVLLAPHHPWCADIGRRVDAWTGSLAVAVVVLLSLLMVEGTSVLLLAQQWQWIAVSAAIVGIGLWLSMRTASRVSSGAVVALAIFILRLPGYDSVTTRLMLAVAATVATIAVAPAAARESVRMPTALALSCASLAALLLGAGSLKLAFVAASLASICAAAATLAVLGRSFSAGPTLSIAALALALALAVYGCAYHAGSGVEPFTFAVVWAAPLLLALPAVQRSARIANATIALIAFICAVIVAYAMQSSQASQEIEETSPSYTSIYERGANDTGTLSWHCTVTV
ncbi:MAG: hypothetical protein EXS17_07260 [Phycisphaerales bacterium]|nr:hypothetical protein [Phycisphaerales bacterium]